MAHRIDGSVVSSSIFHGGMVFCWDSGIRMRGGLSRLIIFLPLSQLSGVGTIYTYIALINSHPNIHSFFIYIINTIYPYFLWVTSISVYM